MICYLFLNAALLIHFWLEDLFSCLKCQRIIRTPSRNLKLRFAWMTSSNCMLISCGKFSQWYEVARRRPPRRAGVGGAGLVPVQSITTPYSTQPPVLAGDLPLVDFANDLTIKSCCDQLPPTQFSRSLSNRIFNKILIHSLLVWESWHNSRINLKLCISIIT